MALTSFDDDKRVVFDVAVAYIDDTAAAVDAAGIDDIVGVNSDATRTAAVVAKVAVAGDLRSFGLA